MDTIEHISNWIAKHQKRYNTISGICQRECEACKTNPNPLISGENCVRNVYQKEFEFYDYYSSLKLLVELHHLDSKLKPLIDDYLQIPENDIKSIDSWCIKALEFEEQNLCNYILENYLVKSIDSQCIGIRPKITTLYKQNPFILPVTGFENVIEFKRIYDKEFHIIKVEPELVLINPNSKN